MNETLWWCFGCGFTTKDPQVWSFHVCPAYITGKDYPVLARIWDNEDDDIYNDL